MLVFFHKIYIYEKHEDGRIIMPSNIFLLQSTLATVNAKRCRDFYIISDFKF